MLVELGLCKLIFVFSAFFLKIYSDINIATPFYFVLHLPAKALFMSLFSIFLMKFLYFIQIVYNRKVLELQEGQRS